MRIERLEPRIAPSTASFTFVDVDGDKVEIKINSDSLITPQAIQNVATLRETAPGSGRFQLESLDLTDSKFSGAKVDIDIDRTVPFDQRPGDSRVNVGYINATGRDLTSVSVNGDLGRIDAGNGDPAKSGVGTLTVFSIGKFGVSTQGAGGNLSSTIKDGVKTFSVNGSVEGATVNVVGKIKTLTVAGDIVGGDA